MSKVYKPSNECIARIKSDTFNRDCGSASQVLEHYIEATYLKRLNSIEILSQKPTLNRVKQTKKQHTFKRIHYCNRIAITFRTLKYAIIFLVSLILIFYLIFQFVIGVIYFNQCKLEPNIPIYLLVTGLTGLLRLFLFFACPFKYSESLCAKIYQTLIQLLIIKRFKYTLQTSKDLNANCCFTFYSYFCSCCCYLKCCLPKSDKLTEPTGTSNDYTDSYSTSKSTTTNSSAISVLLNDACCCFAYVNSCTRPTNLETNFSKNKLKRSQSYTFYKRDDIFYSQNIYSKRTRRNHNKTQQNYKLIDLRSIRYGVAHLLQRGLDLFILVWFILGNYWVFNADMSVSQLNLKLNTTNLMMMQQVKRQENSLLADNETNVTKLNLLSSQCNPVCYKTAFSQILVTYSVFALSFVILITFRIYSMKPIMINNDNNLKRHKKKKFRRRANSLP